MSSIMVLTKVKDGTSELPTKNLYVNQEGTPCRPFVFDGSERKEKFVGIVTIPRTLLHKLKVLTAQNKEVSGELIGRFGKGSIIRYDIRKVNINSTGNSGTTNANYQFTSDSGQQTIHTHSRGTLEKFGKVYGRNFSAADLDTVLGNALAKDGGFAINLLVTPEDQLAAIVFDNVTAFPLYVQPLT